MKQTYKLLLVIALTAIATFFCTVFYMNKMAAQSTVDLVIKTYNEMNSFNNIGRVESYDFLEGLIKKGCQKEALDFIGYQKSSLLSDLQQQMKESDKIRNTVMERNDQVGERAIKENAHRASYEYPKCK